MRSAAIAVLACPSCGRGLAAAPLGSEIVDGSLTCRHEGYRFPVVNGVSQLVVPSRVAQVKAWAEGYARTWAKDGWGSPDETYLVNLPYKDLTGRRSSEWRVKARSMQTLFHFLDPYEHRRVVDMGCGVGWLAWRLAARGHEVYAVDVLFDQRLGLMAAATYVQRGVQFERVLAEMERPPFRDGCIDAVICNASLQYMVDLDAALAGFARILRDGGMCVIMNSPVHHDPASARRAELDFQNHLRGLGAPEHVASSYHHFVSADLENRLATLGHVEEIAFNPGLIFRPLRRAKGVVLRMELATFPIFVATKQSTGRYKAKVLS